MTKQEKIEAQERKESARKFLLSLKGSKVYAIVNWVSHSGMSRRIEFYTVINGEIARIGWYIGQAQGMKYDSDKGGLLVEGCGMDMIFSVLSNLNYAAAKWELGDNYMDIIRKKNPEARVYDNYLFDADRYGRL